MFERGISRRWLHHAAIATYVFFGAYAFLGLAYVWYSAVRGDIVQALLGFGIALGSIGMGVGMHVIVQLAGVVGAQMEQLDSLRQRADASESLLQELTDTVFIPTSAEHDASPIIAANAAAAGFPRLHHDEPAMDATAIPADDGAPTVRRDPDSLRRLFRESVFAHDYASAIQAGDAILVNYPDGEMAAQFRLLKPTLEARLRTA
ncbi:MAG: hypothetical protein HOP29_04075 [Phycisphaerales bacterium]|nr:hypothetical protein [Phycisphaerales bacterium]